jgi:hypothetical protein
MRGVNAETENDNNKANVAWNSLNEDKQKRAGGCVLN